MSIFRNIKLYIVILILAITYTIIYYLYLPTPYDFTFVYYRWLYLSVPSIYFSGIVILLYLLSSKLNIEINMKTKTILFTIGILTYALYMIYMVLFLSEPTQSLLPSWRQLDFLIKLMFENPGIMLIHGVLVAIEMIAVKRGEI